MMITPAVITAPTCRFKTKRRGAHIGIARADICGDCLRAMQASLVGSEPVFCHECGANAKVGDLFGFFYRDTGAMWLCRGCSSRFGAALTSELDLQRFERQALIIDTATAHEEIAKAPTPAAKMTLWQRWRDAIGPRRRV